MRINNNYNMIQNNSDNYKKKSDLSVDDFLKIMAAEISNQSFMGGESGSKTDYISQLAQFTILEQMGLLADNLNTLNYMGHQQYAFSLIGKQVTLADEEGNITGIVEKVKLHNGLAIIRVNEKDYYLNSVIEVSNGEKNGEMENEL